LLRLNSDVFDSLSVGGGVGDQLAVHNLGQELLGNGVLDLKERKKEKKEKKKRTVHREPKDSQKKKREEDLTCSSSPLVVMTLTSVAEEVMMEAVFSDFLERKTVTPSDFSICNRRRKRKKERKKQ